MLRLCTNGISVKINEEKHFSRPVSFDMRRPGRFRETLLVLLLEFDRQPDEERRPRTGRAVHGDAAVVLLDDLVDDEEPEP